jgi:6-phosphogluconolactonase
MLFYAGTYTSLGGPGIAVYTLVRGRLRLLAAAGGIADPIWLVRRGDTLYAAGTDADENGAAASFRIAGERLEFLSLRETGGKEPCHLALDPAGRFLYAANYGSGSVSVLPLAEGRILPRVQLAVSGGHGLHLLRQEAAHPHQAVFRPGTRELFVTDLGTDSIRVYAADEDTGMLALRDTIPCRPGSGPRHLAFANEGLFYLAGELDNTVTLFKHEKNGWRDCASVSTLPAGFAGENIAAALRLADGRLYVSNRGHDSVAVFSIGKDGVPVPDRHLPAHGAVPRDLVVLPDGSLLIANRGGNIAHVGKKGELMASLPLPGAVCVLVP